MLIWTDIETTGLSSSDKILEIAIRPTDDDLKPLADTWSIVLRQSVDLSQIHPDVVAMHSANGLWTEVSKSKFTLDDARDGIKKLFKSVNLQPGEGILAGASVHYDRDWLNRWLSDLHSWFDHRILDVTTLKTIAYRWAPSILKDLPFAKDSNHRAVRDVEIALAQLTYLRKKLF